MRSSDFVRGNVQYHEELNQDIWNGTSMRPEVRKKLLQIAKVFVKYLEVKDFRVLDVVLTGSMANYNWTDYSDLDIHVVTDYDDINSPNIVEAFYKAKKSIWNDHHDIMIRDHEAELYVEDDDHPPVSAGIFSILKNKWLTKPSYTKPEINSRAINRKVSDLMHRIDSVIKGTDDPEDIQRLIDKVYKMRQGGLEIGGEFSAENCSFKILRNMGYIDKLFSEHNKKQDSELSLS